MKMKPLFMYVIVNIMGLIRGAMLKEIAPLEVRETLSSAVNGTSLEVDVSKLIAAVATHGCSDIISSLLGASDGKLSLSSQLVDKRYTKICSTKAMGSWGDFTGEFSIDISIEAIFKARESIMGFADSIFGSMKAEYLCEAKISIKPIATKVWCPRLYHVYVCTYGINYQLLLSS